MYTKPLALALLIAVLLPACTVNYTIGDDPVDEKSSYFEEDANRVNDLIVFGPQPDALDLAVLKDNNIQKVISFRTPDEMDELDFNQAEELESLGIEFANIPIGGDDHPYSPATLQSVINELDGIEAKDGAVLMHCRSGWRASVAGIAYLVKHQGMPLNEALKHAEGWWPLSLEKVMGTEFVLQEIQ